MRGVMIFLSTPSARRATCCICIAESCCIFLSTPSARRATFAALLYSPDSEISIHALREEGDILGCKTWMRAWYFYPRPPRGGRQSAQKKISGLNVFLSTPSARRATGSQALPLR